ncbi:MAG TPA: Gfo/Idh/MocA family oxidoreductase [Thermomicrobiales bacterium]|nr:Gfo/Idh/MocA family oxidoreductase [Thermomicrobiales bacterium]
MSEGNHEDVAAPFGLGIIGAGRVSDKHVAAAAALPHVTLRAVADLDGERADALAAKAHATAYRDYQELLKRDDIDAVVVALPHFLHCQAAVDAADAGKHVLVEKPMALTLEECDRMIAASRQRGVALQVGLTYHYHPASAAAHRMIANGELGSLVTGLEVLHGQRRPESQPAWIMRLDKGGGQMWSNAVHLLDRAMFFAGGKPRVVKAQVGTKMHDIAADDNETILLQFDGGLAVTVIATGFYAGVNAFYGNYVLTRGMINLVGQQQLQVAGGDERAYHEPVMNKTPDGFTRQLASFAIAARSGAMPQVSGQWGRDVTEVILAAFESSRTGREVTLG